MKDTCNRLKFILDMEECHLDLSLIKKFNIEKIQTACKSIKEMSLPVDRLDKNIIDKMVDDNNFLLFLSKLFIKFDLTNELLKKLDSLIEVEKEYQELSVDYNIEEVLFLCEHGLSYDSKVWYYYLLIIEYISKAFLNESNKKMILDNICCLIFLKGEIKELKYIAKENINFMFYDFLCYAKDLKTFLELFKLSLIDKELVNLLSIIYELEYENEFSIITLENLSKLENLPVSEYLFKIMMLLNNDGSKMRKFFNFWEMSAFKYSDLKRFYTVIQDKSLKEIEPLLNNYFNYANALYGIKYPELIEFSNNISLIKDNFLSYAVLNKKSAFLNLIIKNKDIFFQISDNSLLFYSEFYKKNININTLNINNLKDLQHMTRNNIYLQNNQLYTFNEIKSLYGLSKNYSNFYSFLTLSRIDEKLIVFKEIKKNFLLPKIISEEKLKRLAQLLSDKSLSKRMHQDFKHIKALKANTAILLLLYKDELQHLFSEIQSEEEADFLVRNIKTYNFKDYNLSYIRRHIAEFDSDWKNLKKRLKLTEEFEEEYHNEIYQFCIQNNAHISETYCSNIDEKARNKFLKVVKAAIQGKFYDLKYPKEDLERELNIKISNSVLDSWKKNDSLRADGFIIKEEDNFHNTMMLGEFIHTCLSYKNGSYQNCLLANFDSNKKILYIWKDKQIVARAIIRFTKGTIKSNNRKLEFIDVDTNKNKDHENNEKLILFLERLYCKNVNDMEIKKIKEILINYVGIKAFKMQVIPVLSLEYKNCIKDKYILTNYNIFISLSKGEGQYLDSLGGKVTVSSEGLYKNADVLFPADFNNKII